MQGEQIMTYQSAYPEVYYKVQPFVMMACDEMDDAYDYGMPTREMIKQTADRIYEDVCRVHPEFIEQDNYRGMAIEAVSAYNLSGNSVETQQFYQGGVYNDLITIIFLNELFGRRRRRRRYW